MPRKSSAKSSYQVSSAGVNPTEDRAHRMRMYFIAMTLRLACVLSFFWVHGWWVVIPAIGAVALPWFAVMVGNAVAYGGEEQVAAVDTLEVAGPAAAADAPRPEPELLVVDVEPVRRSAAEAPPRTPPAADPQAATPARGETGAQHTSQDDEEVS